MWNQSTYPKDNLILIIYFRLATDMVNVLQGFWLLLLFLKNENNRTKVREALRELKAKYCVCTTCKTDVAVWFWDTSIGLELTHLSQGIAGIHNHKKVLRFNTPGVVGATLLIGNTFLNSCYNCPISFVVRLRIIFNIVNVLKIGIQLYKMDVNYNYVIIKNIDMIWVTC